MPIYKINDHKLTPVKQVRVGLEKTIQSLVEKNLEELLGIKFVSSEFTIHGFRFDTLAFDEKTKSFVVIEYKREKNISVIDQGYSYLGMLLKNQADLVLEYNEKLGKNCKKSEVDWSQTRLIFVSTDFTKFQKEAFGFKDLPFELWEVAIYENDLISFEPITPSEQSVSIKVVAKNKVIDDVGQIIKNYSEEDLVKPQWEKTTNLYETLRKAILEMDNRIEIRPTKLYVGFHIQGKNVIQLIPQKEKIQVQLLRVRPEDVKDFDRKVRYMENSFTWYSQHVSLFDIHNEDDIDYAMSLIKQVHKKFLDFFGY